jgi:hypothetical protein
LNDGRRYSQFIKHSAARNLIAAAEYAASIDRPFTLAISINWTLGHIRRPLQKALQIFLERMGRWLRRRTSEPLYALWAHENADANLNTHPPSGKLQPNDKILAKGNWSNASERTLSEQADL